MKRPLRYYGDPVLRQPARRIEQVDEPLRAFAHDMIETMHAESGIGLAAQQVGETVALCVVDVPERMDIGAGGEPLNPSVEMPLVLMNPEIVSASDVLECAEEGCLSFPDIATPIRRPEEIEVAYLGLDGVRTAVRLRGLVARAVQHEMDHLAGRLIVDHMTPVKKVAYSGRLKRLRRRTQEALTA